MDGVGAERERLMRRRVGPLAMYVIGFLLFFWGVVTLMLDAVLWARGIDQPSQAGMLLLRDALAVWLIRIGMGIINHRPYVRTELTLMLSPFVILWGLRVAAGLSDTDRPSSTDYAIAYAMLGVIAYGVYRYFQRPKVRVFFEGGGEDAREAHDVAASGEPPNPRMGSNAGEGDPAGAE